LTFGEHLVRQTKGLLEDEVDPLPMDRRAGSFALLVVFPLLEGQLHKPRVVRVMRVEPVRKHALQHRHREERAGHVDQ
jgi:hypothetical protein